MQLVDSQIEELLRKNAEGQELVNTLVSIKDLARNRFHPPRAVQTLREAIRDFADLSKQDPMISKHSSDFELYHVGVFNPVNASCQSIEPIRLARASDYASQN